MLSNAEATEVRKCGQELGKQEVKGRRESGDEGCLGKSEDE